MGGFVKRVQTFHAPMVILSFGRLMVMITLVGALTHPPELAVGCMVMAWQGPDHSNLLSVFFSSYHFFGLVSLVATVSFPRC